MNLAVDYRLPTGQLLIGFNNSIRGKEVLKAFWPLFGEYLNINYPDGNPLYVILGNTSQIDDDQAKGWGLEGVDHLTNIIKSSAKHEEGQCLHLDSILLLIIKSINTMKEVTSTVTIGDRVEPLADRVLILPNKAEEKTAGGIYIPKDSQEKQQQGTVMSKGEQATGKASRGDTVLYGEHAGTEIELEGHPYIMVKESELLSINRTKQD